MAVKMNEKSLLATTDPSVLIIFGLCFCLLGYICARVYRNTNDFAKSVRAYIPSALVVGAAALILFQVDGLLLLGQLLCGFVVMAIASNHFFYSNK
jgi:hypothetical protein